MKLQWIWYCLPILILCLIVSILYPGFFLSYNFYDLCILILFYLVIEVFILTIGLYILRKFNLFGSLKFIVYLVLVVALCAIANLVMSYFNLSLRHTHYVYLLNYIMLFISLFFVLFNIVLSKFIFVINTWIAIVAGLLLGLINAIMSILFATSCH
jgi:hypothetical protein